MGYYLIAKLADTTIVSDETANPGDTVQDLARRVGTRPVVDISLIVTKDSQPFDMRPRLEQVLARHGVVVVTT
jgi:hypothetical protein